MPEAKIFILINELISKLTKLPEKINKTDFLINISKIKQEAQKMNNELYELQKQVSIALSEIKNALKREN